MTIDLAETVNGLYKAEVIHRRGPWRSFEAVELATLEWVDWFNNRRLLEPIRKHPAGRSRGTPLRHARAVRHGGVAQTKWPPPNPARFIIFVQIVHTKTFKSRRENVCR